MAKTVKRLLIKSVPTLWQLLCLSIAFIVKEFGIRGWSYDSAVNAICLPVLIHPFYLVVCSYKEKATKFFRPYFEMLILLLPYFAGGTVRDSFSRDLGNLICGGEYILTSMLWVGAYIIKKYDPVEMRTYKDVRSSEKIKRIEVILTNIIPFIFIGAVQYAVCFESYFKGSTRDLLYTLFYTTEFVSLAGGVYYSKVNKGLLGSGKKAGYISLAMILSCLTLQCFISFFTSPENGFYIWLAIKYICQLIGWGAVWSDDFKLKKVKSDTE